MKVKVKFKKHFDPALATRAASLLAVEGATVQIANGAQHHLDRNGSIVSGDLIRSIDYEVKGSKGVVFTPIEYGKYVEYGTRPHKIRPRNAKVLRWIDKLGNVIFAREVNHPGGKAYPYMRPAAADVIRDFPKILRQVRASLERRYG